MAPNYAQGLGRFNPNDFEDQSLFSKAFQNNGVSTRQSTQALANGIQGMVDSNKDEQNKAKAQAILAKMQDPNDPDFKDLTQSQKYAKASQLLLPYDENASKRYLDASQETAKDETKVNTEKELQPLYDNYKKSLDAYSASPSDETAKNNVRYAIAELKRKGVTQVENPIDDTLRQNQIDAMSGFHTSSLEQNQEQFDAQQKSNEEKFQNMLDEQKKDRDLQWANFNLQKKKLDDEAKKTPAGDKVGGVTEAQKQKAIQADAVFDELAPLMTDNFATTIIGNGLTSHNTIINAIANKVATDDQQRVGQAFQSYRNIVGRVLSGAAIGDNEWTAFENDIPKYGDTQPVLEQKKANRMAWIDNMVARANKNALQSSVIPVDTSAAVQQPAAKKNYTFTQVGQQ